MDSITEKQVRKSLALGITEKGVLHTDRDEPLDLDTRFRMVAESGVYDYYDKTPEDPADVDAYLAASEKYSLPIRAGGWFYTLGRDEQLLRKNLQMGAQLGSVVHNTQVLLNHADGHQITNDEVAEFYLQAAEWGDQYNCHSTFEVHINMWSEDFRRVSQVADIVERKGVPFRMTLDHSHVIFKIDNPGELDIAGIREAVNTGDCIIDPSVPGNVCEEWIERGFVSHCHARAAVPNNPINSFGHHPDGSVGRGCQYPFIKPRPGEYVTDWHEERLEPWKSVLRKLMAWHLKNESSVLGQISTEFIPNPDYGAGHGYSIFDNSVACARWLRKTFESSEVNA